MTSTLLFVGGIGAGEAALILTLALILFGSNRIPELARSLGRAQSEFRRGVAEAAREAQASHETPDLDARTQSDGEWSDRDQ